MFKPVTLVTLFRSYSSTGPSVSPFRDFFCVNRLLIFISSVLINPKLSASHSANSTLARPASHWSRDWRQIALIGRFTASPRTFAPTTALQWQSAARIHLFKVPTGPFVCEMVHLGVFERFSDGATRFGDLSSWEPAGGGCLGRWGSLMEYWQIRLSARFDRGETPHTILPLPTNGAH